MPTPFMHLAAAHRFLTDSSLPESPRTALAEHLGAFLLGNVAPDARVSTGLRRENTHFFDYQAHISPPPGEVMLQTHPQLASATGAQAAFVAGYLAHLAMDVVWAEAMLFPYFYTQDWTTSQNRYNMLHVLLCELDARDYRQWPEAFAPALAEATPRDWLPFLTDADLIAWRDIIARQICDDCASETIPVLGRRVNIGAEGLEEVLNSPAEMNTQLWQYIPQAAVQEVNSKMYAAMTAHVLAYMNRNQE